MLMRWPLSRDRNMRGLARGGFPFQDRVTPVTLLQLHTLLAPVLAALAAPAVAAEPEVPVMIGRDGPDLDACGAIGKVARLDPAGDNFLSVRERPTTEAPEKDRLDARTLVWLCDSADEWQGIVYPSADHQDLGDCRVGSPVRVAEAYAGPCRHGWVAAHYIELVAG